MALLTEAQQKARDLAREIGKMENAFVVSPPGSMRLRIQIIHPCDRVLATLTEWGWKPIFITNTTRFHSPDGTMRLASVYEIVVEDERPQMANNGRITDTKLADPGNKPDATGERLKKYLSIK